MIAPKVLIIDDSTTECLYMQRALLDAGYQAVVAGDGYQGLQMMAQEQPQCLVLDIVLPGMSGFEVCRYIRSQDGWKNLPILVVSTKNSSSDRFWALRQGANEYLAKPFKGEQLVQAVKGVLTDNSRPPSPQGDTNRMPPAGQEHSTNQRTNGVPPVNTGRFTNPVAGQTNGAPQSQQTRSSSSPGHANAGSPVNQGRPSSPGVTNPIPSFNQMRSSVPGQMDSGNDGLGANLNRSTGPGTPSMTPLPRLIPHRNESTDSYWANPSDSPLFTERPVRQLFTAIDGQKNVEMLALVTRLSRDEMLYALRLLLSQRWIVLCDLDGRAVENPFL